MFRSFETYVRRTSIIKSYGRSYYLHYSYTYLLEHARQQNSTGHSIVVAPELGHGQPAAHHS